MARQSIDTKVEIKTNGFVPVWPAALDIEPLHSVQISPTHTAHVYHNVDEDAGRGLRLSSDTRGNPHYVIIIDPPTEKVYMSRLETLLDVRLNLDNAVRVLNKVSVKRTRVDHDED